MSEYHYIFIHPGQPEQRLISDISFACGVALRAADSEFIDYSAHVGHAAVEVELSHEYEEDIGVPFEKYDSLLSIRDLASDLTRQESLARTIFRNLASLERYSLVLVLDLQVLLDSASPRQGTDSG